MRSSPSSCFIKQTAAVIAGTGTPNLLAEYSQALSTHIPTFSNTDGSWSQLSMFSVKEFAFPEGNYSEFTTLHQANLDNKQHLKTLASIWAPGCVSQQTGWVFRKTAKSHKLSWILHLKEKKPIRFLGKRGWGREGEKCPVIPVCCVSLGMQRSWISACGIALDQENIRDSANSQKLVGKAKHQVGLDIGNQDNPVLLWMRAASLKDVSHLPSAWWSCFGEPLAFR